MTPPAAAAAIPATRPAPARRGAPTRPTDPAPARRTRPTDPARTRPSRPRGVAAPGRRSERAAQAASAALSPARLLERLIRSRSWIGLVAFALIGIVAMQLWLLKLNGGIGRAIEHEGLLQRQNAVLSAENSSAAAGDLVEQQAIASGMRILAPGSLIFLRTRGKSDERLAAARLAQPVQTPAQGESATTSSTAPATESAASTVASAAHTTEPAAENTSTSTPPASATQAAPSTVASSAPATQSTPSTVASSAPATQAAPATSTSTASEAGG